MFTVPLGPKRAWASAAAQSGIYAAQKSLSTETKNILLEAADAAIEVMYLREKGEIYEQLAQQSGQITAIQSESFKAAIVPYRNVVLAELAAYNLELDRRKTTAELNQARVRLARAMGIPNGSPPGLDGRLTFERTALPPLAAVLDRAGSVSPELAKTCGGIQQSRQEHQYERWNALPDISVGPRLEKDLGNSLNDELGARLQWDLPIFNRNQGNIAETAADIQTRCAEYEVARVTTLNDVAALYLELEDSQARGDYFQTRVRPLIEQSEQSLRTVFEDRAATAYELTKLMETLSRMKLSDLDLRHDHHRLRTRLEMLLECPLSSLGVGELPPLPPAGLGPAPIPPPQEAPVEQP
jgi:cobalt-zinc-cadmium efflux system outer membrane protein